MSEGSSATNTSLWYILAEANALTDGDLFAGQLLKVPEVKTSKNDASTFKPYNPAEATGPTEPSTPYIAPPPPQQCNSLAIMIVAAIAIAITVVVAPWATTQLLMALPAMGATGVGITAAAGYGIGAMAGSVASQVVGKALGAVDHFSLRNVAAAGITAGLTQGISGWLGGSTSELIRDAKTLGNWGRVAVSAATTAATGYVGSGIAGVDDTHFSWKSIAAQTVSSVISAKASMRLGAAAQQVFGGTGDFRGDVVSGLTGGVVSLHVRRAFGFNDQINYGNIAADAFGNALGNAAARGIQSYRAGKAKAEWAANQAQHDREMLEQDSAVGGLDSPAQYSTASGQFLGEGFGGTSDATTAPKTLSWYEKNSQYWAEHDAQFPEFSSLIGPPGANSDLPTQQAYFERALEVEGILGPHSHRSFGPSTDPTTTAATGGVPELASVVVTGDSQLASQLAAASQMPRDAAPEFSRLLGNVVPGRPHYQTMFGDVTHKMLEEYRQTLMVTRGSVMGAVDVRAQRLQQLRGEAFGRMLVNPLTAAVYGMNSGVDEEMQLRNTIGASAILDTAMVTGSASTFSGTGIVRAETRATMIAGSRAQSAYLREKYGALTSEQRLARIDELAQANWIRRIEDRINSQDYVFKYLTASGLQTSLEYNSIRGYATTTFSSSSSEVMGGAQILGQWPSAPYTGPVLYGAAIPVNRLQGFSVARPMGGSATTGWEVSANSYPSAGPGGYTQLLIEPVPISQTYLFTLKR